MSVIPHWLASKACTTKLELLQLRQSGLMLASIHQHVPLSKVWGKCCTITWPALQGKEWMEGCLKTQRLIACSLHFSIHCSLHQCHSRSLRMGPFFPGKNLIMRKIHIGKNVFYSHSLLTYSRQRNIFLHSHWMILALFSYLTVTF